VEDGAPAPAASVDAPDGAAAAEDEDEAALEKAARRGGAKAWEPARRPRETACVSRRRDMVEVVFCGLRSAHSSTHVLQRMPRPPVKRAWPHERQAHFWRPRIQPQLVHVIIYLNLYCCSLDHTRYSRGSTK
jgi:hypothetical protein